jgi:Flp pilus assembly protein TadD
MDRNPPRRSRRRWWLLLGLVILAAASAWGASVWQRHRPSPPRPDQPALPSPLLSTRAGVKYVGTARCAGCHVKEAASYARHPMGRSVSPPDRRLPGQPEAANAFDTAGLHYAVEHSAAGTFHRESAAGSPTPVEAAGVIALAVGSGRQGQSFLVNRDGFLFQSPISWYTRDRAWGLSPDFQRRNQHFSRPIPEGCLFCHTNEARTEPDTINRFRPGPAEPVGCERCHGPGELHVAARLRGEGPAGEDLTIVNPRRLDPDLRDAVCEQCHLQGEARVVRRGRALYDYRPGLPLSGFVSVYVRPPDEVDTRRAVSHVEQMRLSRCFRSSGGKMGCISCHDPHVLPAAEERVSWYRGRCLGCHQETSCTLAADERRRHNPADSCIDCHMPRGDSSNVAHTAVTDHRIVRRAGADADAPGGGLTLVAFHHDGGSARDLGLALDELLDRPLPEPQRRELARRACELLTPAADSAPDDLPAVDGLGHALHKDKRPHEALAVLEKVLARAPRRELTLQKAALAAMELGENERAAGYWRRLLEVNPHTWEGHGYLAQTLALSRQWGEAVVECRAALRLNPFETRTRMLLIDCLLRSGEKKQAGAEFETLLFLLPEERDRLQRWFDELSRPGG